MDSIVRTTRVYQALTPPAASELQRFRGLQLQTSSPFDTYAMLKLHRGQARAVARNLWCRQYPWSAIVEIELASIVLERLPQETIAYEEHREYAVPVDQLTVLSAAMLKPAHIVEYVRVLHPAPSRPAPIEADWTTREFALA